MDYDITVIGGGPGGYVAAIKGAQMGKRVCIIEQKRFGGVCLNEGCIPTKTLIKTANLYHEIKGAEIFGIEGIQPEQVSVSMQRLQKRKTMVVSQLVGGVEGLLRKNKVDMVKGKARFEDTHTILVGEREITSEYFIIASGSEAVIPGFIEYEGKTDIITSREALNLREVPQKIVIVGGGVIGIEFAHIFSLLGSEVHIIEILDQILPMVDREVSAIAQKRLEQQGVRFHLSCGVQKITGNKVNYKDRGAEKVLETEKVLMAVGRKASTEGMNLEGIGVLTGKNGIITDLHLKTNLDNIFAIGDANGKSMLAHTASHEGITAVEHICGHKHAMDYNRVPSCIYLEPEIACIGFTQEQAVSQGFKIKVGKFPMIGNGKSLVEGNTEGLIKVILEEETGEILGVHMIAKHATDMIGEICTAMNLEATGLEIAQSVHPHPTVSEAVGEGFMAAVFGRSIHA